MSSSLNSSTGLNVIYLLRRFGRHPSPFVRLRNVAQTLCSSPTERCYVSPGLVKRWIPSKTTRWSGIVCKRNHHSIMNNWSHATIKTCWERKVKQLMANFFSGDGSRPKDHKTDLSCLDICCNIGVLEILYWQQGSLLTCCTKHEKAKFDSCFRSAVCTSLCLLRTW